MWVFRNTNKKLFIAFNFARVERYSVQVMDASENGEKIITEGLAKVKTFGKVFYNPVQEFNRDLSISVLSTFADIYRKEKKLKTLKEDVVAQVDEEKCKAGVEYGDGITILEALAATGLRSIRYAKEIPGVKRILANDISYQAVEIMKANIVDNEVAHLVTASQNDATMLMYERRKDKFDAIDLDPYGCPSHFLDGAVQSVQEGGMLLVTCTDMAVLAGNSPETCYSKYGSVSLRLKACHEMALRILLQCIESHANRYGRYVVPLLSVSVDFYIRVFVRVYSGSYKCKFTLSKLAMVYHCTSCDSFKLQPLGSNKKNDEKGNVKFFLPAVQLSALECEHCKHSLRMGGPIWAGPLHDQAFVAETLSKLPTHLKTYRRLTGILTLVQEELDDCPMSYSLERLFGAVHGTTPPMLTLRSALLNAGYRVSYTHTNKTCIKTDAPARVVWDIVRCWIKDNPVSEKRLVDGSVTKNILAIEPEKQYSFERHPDANPESRRQGVLRYQMNPLPFWGPGIRATTMTGDDKMLKSRKNQGKRKREESEEKDGTKTVDK